jgi:ELWxxDGT repeat protein
VSCGETDGTQAGTVLVKDINPGPGDSWPSGFTPMNDVLFFIADSGSGRAQLWKSDGSTAGTVFVAEVGADFSITDLMQFDRMLFFVARVATCEAGDRNDDGQITIDEIVAAVDDALKGECT